MLEWIYHRPDQAWRADGYARAMDFGGYNGSHHSATATRLARKGLVDRRKLPGPGGRGSCSYKITKAGLAALKANARVKG